jgi:hypothetical protein
MTGRSRFAFKVPIEGGPGSQPGDDLVGDFLTKPRPVARSNRH